MNTYVTPQTLSTKLTRVGYGFFVLIMLASYTANLATTLVTAPVVTYQVANIDEAASKGLSVCAFSAAAITTLKTFYPSIKVVTITTTDAAVCLQALIAGQCGAAVLFQSDWDAVVNKKAGNTGCVLAKVGRSVMPFNGGWAYNQDLASNCTSGMEATISSQLISYQSSGSFSNQYSIDLSVYWDQSCATDTVKATAVPITIYEIAGPYVIFAGTLLFAFIISILSGIWTNNQKNGRDGWRAVPIVGTAGMVCFGEKAGHGCLCAGRGAGDKGAKDGVDADGRPVAASAGRCGCWASCCGGASAATASEGAPATDTTTSPTGDRLDAPVAAFVASQDPQGGQGPQGPQGPPIDVTREEGTSFVVKTRTDKL